MFGLVSVPVVRASLPVALDASEFLKLLYPPPRESDMEGFSRKGHLQRPRNYRVLA